MTAAPAAPPARLVDGYDVVLLDLDGVVYLGSRPIPGAGETVSALAEAGVRVGFVTNNASRTPEAVAAHLVELGCPATPDQVVTSAQAAAALLAERFAGAGAASVLAVGGEGLRRALTEVGCRLVGSADDRPDVVVQGFAPELRYADLAEAALAVAGGAWWVATNRDRTLPTERGTQPGNGALVEAVATAAGRGPDQYAGKPDQALIREAVRRTGARRPLVVGDRLDTDIEGAARAGLDSVCVLTGVADGTHLVAAPTGCRPTHLVAGVPALLNPPPAPAARTAHGWTAGGWTVRRARAELRVTGTPDPGDGPADPVDLLRAACAAAWDRPDGEDPPARLVIPDGAREEATAARLDRLLG